MSLWSDDDAQSAASNASHVKDELSGLSSAQLATLQQQAAILQSGKSLEVVGSNEISKSDLARMLPSGHLAGLEGEAFVQAAQHELQINAAEQHAKLEKAKEEGLEGADEGLAAMAAAAAGENPLNTHDIIAAEKEIYNRDLAPQIKTATAEFRDGGVDTSTQVPQANGLTAATGPSPADAPAPNDLTPAEKAALAAFDKPQPAPQPTASSQEVFDVPVPSTRPTVEEQIDKMVGSPAPAPLAAELGGPQGTVTSQSTTVDKGDTLWSVSTAMLEMEHQSHGDHSKPTQSEIANYTKELAAANNIQIDEKGFAAVHEGQRLELPKDHVIDFAALKANAHHQDTPTPQAAAPAAPELAAPAVPEPAAAEPEPAAKQGSTILERAQQVAEKVGLGGMFGGMFAGIQELANAMHQFSKNEPADVAKGEQGVNMQEQLVLGSLAKPSTPMAKGGQATSIA